jgi:hypothetical protein
LKGAHLLTLLSEWFAPITESFGFLEVPLDDAVVALSRWRESLYTGVVVTRLQTGFPAALHALEPLTDQRPRELLVAAGRWTAYFDNLPNGTDPVSAVGKLSRDLKCQAVLATSIPDTESVAGVRPGRSGQVGWSLLGPIQTDFINYVRSVSVTFDGGRWRFDAHGTVQGFEETDAYRARRIRDRFNSTMLQNYCREMGIDVFNPNFYGPECVLVESVLNHVPRPPQSLAETQIRLGIVPGEADSLPG